jgi:hypothetical protein
MEQGVSPGTPGRSKGSPVLPRSAGRRTEPQVEGDLRHGQGFSESRWAHRGRGTADAHTASRRIRVAREGRHCFLIELICRKKPASQCSMSSAQGAGPLIDAPRPSGRIKASPSRHSTSLYNECGTFTVRSRI